MSAVIVAPLCYLIELFWKVRITPLNCSGLGHLAINTHMFVASQRENGQEPRTSRIFFGAVPSNRQLFEMWKRYLPVFESRAFFALYQYSEPVLSKLPTFKPLPPNARFENQYELVHKAGQIMTFSPTDEIRGQELLERMGVEKDAWFVCFQSRDATYHIEREGADVKSHRNCNIETFMKTAKYISSLGGYAIRVGKSAAMPIPETGDPRIIDFANEYWTDFGDIYLIGNCRFFLGCATGTISIPALFDIPYALANNLPYTTPPNIGGMFIPKLLRSRESGQLMHFKEIADYLGAPESFLNDSPLDDIGFYENEFLSVVDNSETEILDLCKDMLDQLDGIPVDSDAQQLQRRFKEYLFGNMPDRIYYSPNISGRFATRYRNLIED